MTSSDHELAARRLAYSPAEAARVIGIGRTKLYEAISTGALRSSKFGNRRLISDRAIAEWLVSLEEPAGAADAR